jgi:hypothetical protein
MLECRLIVCSALAVISMNRTTNELTIWDHFGMTSPLAGCQLERRSGQLMRNRYVEVLFFWQLVTAKVREKL